MSEKIPDDVAAGILARCGRCCCLCRRFRPTMLQVHHIVETSEGGTNEPDNLIAICLTCHLDFHTKRPFTRRFTVEELQQHRDAVVALVAEGKLIPPDDDYGHVAGHSQGPTAATSDSDVSFGSIVIAGGDLIEPALPSESIDVLLAAAESRHGHVLMVRSASGLSVLVDQHNFVPSRMPRDEARYKHAVEQLAENGLLDGVDRVFTVTHRGFLLADELLALRQ